ncbi:MAG: phage major capsid protein [Rhizobiales bacterium]|nr:phage major capsid protein [Hyphomicrobiales bacterium]
MLSGHAPETKDEDPTATVLAEIKKAVEDVSKGWEEYKSTNDQRLKEIEKKGAADPVTTDKLAKIEKTLGDFEGLNQKLVAIEKVNADAKKERDELELKLNRMSLAGANPEQKKAELKKRVNTWGMGVLRALILGEPNLSQDERKAIEDVRAEYKALSVTDDTTGGYLAPVEYVQEIIKGITEVSPVRSLVRVRTTANKSIQIPKRTGQFAAQWVSEQGPRTETDGLRYGMVEIPTHEIYALIDISQQNLEDSAFDLEAELSSESEEQFSVAEGAAVVSGNGVGKPQGFLDGGAGLGSTNSGSAATIADVNGQADGIITLFHSLKTGYVRNAKWALNRTTLGSVRKLKDTDKQYIWMPGVANGVPNTILGAPYVEVPDMPNENANAYPMAFGDFERGYTLVDRIAMALLRDPYTQATAGNIRFIFRKRLGGQVTLSEAIRLLKCST